MSPEELRARYFEYIDCLNSQEWDRLDEFVDESVEYNSKLISVSGYRAMLQNDFRAIPDLKFQISFLCSDPPIVASRLNFNCTPIGILFGIPVNGRHVRFSENVFYEFRARKILKVWSIIDYAAIKRQLAAN